MGKTQKIIRCIILRNTIAPHMRSLTGALSSFYPLTACGNSSTKTLAKPDSLSNWAVSEF